MPIQSILSANSSPRKIRKILISHPNLWKQPLWRDYQRYSPVTGRNVTSDQCKICIWNTTQHPLLLVGGKNQSFRHLRAYANYDRHFPHYGSPDSCERHSAVKNSCNCWISELTGELAYSTEEINASAMPPLSDAVHLSKEGWTVGGGGCDYSHVKAWERSVHAQIKHSSFREKWDWMDRRNNGGRTGPEVSAAFGV